MRYLPLLGALILLSVQCGSSPRVELHGVFAPSRLGFIAGQDGVSSIPLTDTVTIWTFGDTMVGKPRPGAVGSDPVEKRYALTAMPSGTLAWSRRPDERSLKSLQLNFLGGNEHPSELLPPEPGENPFRDRLWPFDGIRIGDSVYLFYVHAVIDDPKRYLAFSIRYVGLAVWDIPRGWKGGDPVHFVRKKIMFPGNGPLFGSAVMLHEGYCYLLGHYRTAGGATPLKVARVDPAQIENPGAYRYLDGKGAWSALIDEAEPFFHDTIGEPSISWNKTLEHFVILYSKIGSGELMAVLFRDFNGLSRARPFPVYLPPPLNSGEGLKMYYSGKEVAAFDRSLFAIYIDPSLYQPFLVEIPYALLRKNINNKK